MQVEEAAAGLQALKRELEQESAAVKALQRCPSGRAKQVLSPRENYHCSILSLEASLHELLSFHICGWCSASTHGAG